LRINIHHKITSIFIIINAFILLGIFLYLSHNLRTYTHHRIKTNLRKQLSLCQSYLSDVPFSSIDSHNFDDIADRIGHNLDLRVTIIGLDGTVYGDSKITKSAILNVENHLYRAEVQKALHEGMGESRRFSTTIQKDFLYLASVFNKDGAKGIIRLSIPLSEIKELLSRLRHTLALSLLAAFLLSILVSYLASYFISRPIKEISSAAGEIAKGNYSNKIQLESNDEIGNLASTFNYMSGEVQARIAEVNENKSRLEAVFSSMFEGVMVIDANGSILLINEALKNFLSIKKSDPRGKKPIEIISNLEIQEIADNTLHLSDKFISKEISTVLPERKVLLIHATPLKKKGTTQGGVLVFHDVTHVRNLEKIRQDFVANVSHELKTPICSIKGYAETLLEGAIEDKTNAKDFLNIILSDSNRLANLIDDLLSLAKIESDQLLLESHPYKLFPILKKVLTTLKGQIDKKSIFLKIDIPKNISSVLIDETRIKQVLLNLIDNAIKYNNPKGKISVSAKEINNFIKINITDTGIGIPNRDLSRIFERFYRVDKARSRELGGTGLGLSIVKHIIQSHKGEISVTSIEGQGSTFSFTLPKA